MKRLALIICIFCLFFSTYAIAAEVSAEVSAEATATSTSASAIASASTSGSSGSEACATCLSCATVKIAVVPVQCQVYRMVTIDSRFPLGFPSIAEETKKITYSDPLLVLWDKLENIETERIRDEKYLIKAQAYFWVDGGCLVIRRVFAANPGEYISLLATTWKGLKYELPIDKPGSVINKMYYLSGLIELAQRPDNSWGFRIK